MDKQRLADCYQKYRTVVCAGVLFLFFAWVTYYSGKTPVLVTTISVDAKFWPRVIGITGCIFSLLMLVQSLLEIRQKEKNEKISGKTAAGSGQMNRSFQTLGLIFLYILGLSYLGFFLMTGLYLFFQFLVLSEPGKRNLKRLVLISVIFTIGVYLVFHYAFSMVLPKGSLFVRIGGML